MPDKVTIIRPDGSRFEASPAQAKKLEVLGYKIEAPEAQSQRLTEGYNQEDFTTLGEKAKTAGEGFLSGLTLGGTDLLLTDKESRARASYNPGVRIASEIVGAIVPDIVTAGAAAPASAARVGATGAKLLEKGLARRAIEATPAGLISRGARGIEEGTAGWKGVAAGQAFQGAAQGTGAAITNAQLSGDPLTIESVLAAAGPSSIIGAGAGVLGSKLSKLGSKISDVPVAATGTRAVSKAEDEVLDSFYASLPKETPTGVGLKTAAELESDIPAVEKVTNQIEREIAEPDVSHYNRLYSSVRESSLNVNTAVKRVESELNDAISAINPGSVSGLKGDGQILLDQLGDTVPDKITGTMKKIARENNIPLEATTTPEEFINALRARATTNSTPEAAAMSKIKSALGGKTADEITQKLKEFKVISATRLPEEVSRAVKKAQELVEMKAAAKVLIDFPDSLDALRKIKAGRLEKTVAALDIVGSRPEFAAINEHVDTLLQNIGLQADGKLSDKVRTIWESNKAPSMFKKQVVEQQKLKFNHPEPGEPVMAGSAPSGPTPPKSEFPEIVHEPVAGETAGLAPTGKAQLYDFPGNQISQHVNPRSKTFWERFMYRSARYLSGKTGAGFARKLGLGFVGGGIGYELGGTFASSMMGASVLGAASGARTGVGERIRNSALRYVPAAGKAMRAVASRTTPLAVRIDGTIDERTDKKELFKSRLEEIQNTAHNVGNAAFEVVEPMVGNNDAFATAFVKAAQNASDVLQEFLPRDPGLAYSKGVSTWKPTDIQVRQAEKAFAVYNDPVATIEDLVESRRPDTFTVAVLKKMWPALYAEFQSEMIQKIADPAVMSKMTRDDQNHISILIGIPLSSNMTPRSIAASQDIYAKRVEAEVMAKQKGSKGGGGANGRPPSTEPPTAGQVLVNQ